MFLHVVPQFICVFCLPRVDLSFHSSLLAFHGVGLVRVLVLHSHCSLLTSLVPCSLHHLRECPHISVVLLVCLLTDAFSLCTFLFYASSVEGLGCSSVFWKHGPVIQILQIF